MEKCWALRLLLLLLCFLAGSTAVAAPIYYDHTDTFSLTDTPEQLIRYEGKTPDSLYRRFSETTSLTFPGAPQSFVLAGQNYSLVGVSAIFTSTYYAKFLLQAVDSDYFSDVYVTGSATTTSLVQLVPQNQLLKYWYDGWQDTMYYEQVLFGEKDSDPAKKDGYLNQNYNFTYAWTDLSFFSANSTFDISVEKYVNMAMNNFYADDNWDSVGNPINNWLGSLTMRYAYDIQNGSQPVPEPATLLLLGAGLIGLAGYGREKLN